MTITVRLEEKRDQRRLEEIARDAFWNLYIPGAHEHYVVHVLREHPDTIPELSLVIEEDGELLGAVYYTRSCIVRPDGPRVDCITLGPVFIDPTRHRQGLGRQLIATSLERARELGFSRVIILGYPYHYQPYGFVGGKVYGIAMPDGEFYTGLQALELRAGSLSEAAGYAQFSSVFEITQEEVDLFDLEFPTREKCVLPSQEEYARACSEIDV